MTTIAIDARKLADFGIGTYLRGLIGGLAAIDAESRYVLLAPREQREQLADLPANFAWIDEASPGYSLREQLTLSRRLDEISPDLFHAPHYVLPALTPARTIVTIHDLIHLVHPEFLPHPLALPYARFMLRRAARRARRIVTVSQATAHDLSARLGVAAERIVVAWNGVDDRFRAPVAASELARRLGALGLEAGYLLFVGNPKPHKNLERLRAAFAAVAAPGATLVIAGGAARPSHAAPDRRIVELGRVSVNDLPFLYRGAAALLFPSLYEGFGLPVAEAMAAGTPVIASSTAAVAEVAGEAALLVDPLDVAGWSAAIARLLAEPELGRALAARGRERAESFRWEHTARRTLEAYRAVLAERAP